MSIILNKYTLVLAIFLLAIVPRAARAQSAAPNSNYTFSSQGILGCGQQGSYAMSVGALSAIGGVYVPVNDAAVTLNTGTLVYKECVLRSVVDKISQNVLGSLFRQAYTSVQTGNNGNPQYSVNTYKEADSRYRDPVAIAYINKNLGSVDPSFRSTIQHALARNYMAEKRPDLFLKCNFTGGNLRNYQTNKTDFNPDLFVQAAEPQCQGWIEYHIAKEQMNSTQASAVSQMHEQLTWGRGTYSITDNASNPLDARVLTPASVAQSSFQNTLDQSTNMVASANDIGQLPGALLAGLSTQILSGVGNGTLAGLAQSAGGQSSYLDQVARETSQGILTGAANAALTILAAAQQVEANFLQLKNNMASILTQTILQLRSSEGKCWDLVIPAVQQYATSNGITIRVTTATSTYPFAQQVINSQVAPIASTTLNDIAVSQRALQLITQLITSVSNTSSTNAQQVAITQFDALAGQHAFHTQYDVQRAQQGQTDIQTTMTNLVADTIKAWGDSTDPTVGWCNINNPAVLQMWANRWKQ